MDLGQLTGAQRAAPRGGGLDGARVVAGVRTAVSLQALMTIADARGVHSQFAHDLRMLVAGQRGLATVQVVQPAGSSALRIEVDRQSVAVPPALRDAVLTLLATTSRAANESSLTAPAAPSVAAPAAASTPTASGNGAPPATANAVTWSQSVAAQSVADSLRATLATTLAAAPLVAQATPRATRAADAQRVTALMVDDVLFDPQHGERAAAGVRRAVEHSGLFFESHLAQWAAGQRSADALRSELAHVQRGAGDIHGTHASGGERVAVQLEVLQRGAVALQAQAWGGQPCTLTLRRESDSEPEGAPAPTRAAPGTVYSATLSLALPKLGPLEVTLRLAGQSVAVTAAASPAARAQVAAQLDALGSALQARGLNPAALLLQEPA